MPKMPATSAAGMNTVVSSVSVRTSRLTRLLALPQVNIEQAGQQVTQVFQLLQQMHRVVVDIPQIEPRFFRKEIGMVPLQRTISSRIGQTVRRRMDAPASSSCIFCSTFFFGRPRISSSRSSHLSPSRSMMLKYPSTIASRQCIG